jgi:hypothetical protein
MNVTELSDERDFNRLLVDVTDYKFERTAHFLGALLQEKKELKKLELAVDPRKFEGRADNTIQILIPEDLLEFWENNPSALPFALPHQTQKVVDQGFLLPAAQDTESESSADKKRLPEHERNQYVYAHLQNQPSETLKVPIRKTKRLVNAVKSPKYKLNRFSEAKKSCIHMGHLIAGTGWFLGPVEQPKLTKRKLDDLSTLWPFHDQSLPLEQRADLLAHFMAVLLGRFDEEIQRLVQQKNAVKNIFNPIVRHKINQKIELLKALRSEQYSVPQQNLPKTGLAVVTNTDTKELDVAVVVHGRIRQQLKLPVEDADKLRSSRFFTRLMAPYHAELKNDDQCIEFTEDVCNDLELFSYWISRRKGEGDWVDFATLEPLYNPQVSE